MESGGSRGDNFFFGPGGLEGLAEGPLEVYWLEKVVESGPADLHPGSFL